ncbi:MAG: type IV toxin-antitoxin system AbiEi family antitoxin domain-containing protein [Bacteroidales bacterium]
MINKNISTRSGALLTHFLQKDMVCFDFAQAREALPGSSESALKELVSDMVRRGLLMRLKKGLYHIIPYEQDPEAFVPDWHLLAQHLTKGTEHYIAYYSALQIHNLITQPSLKEQIVVAKQIRPSTIFIKHVEVQFIYHNENHFFGSKEIWMDAYNRVWCSDLEKTLVDCLFKPEYAGGIVEIARALMASKENLDFLKLLDYAMTFKSQAVIKRLGFLLETLEIKTQITNRLHRVKTPSFVLLDTELPKSGKLINRWSIHQNLETETIQSAIST